MNYNPVSGQISSVGGNVGSYETKVDKLVRRTDLLEHKLKQYFRWFVFDVRKY